MRHVFRERSSVKCSSGTGEVQPFHELPPDVSKHVRSLNSVGCSLYFLHVEEHARMLHVRLDAYFAGDHCLRDAGLSFTASRR